MTSDDIHEFVALLDSVCTLMTRGRYSPNDDSSAIFFNALAQYPMDRVRMAFGLYVQSGTYAPVPADLLNILHNDGRPGAEEAWAIVQQTRGGEPGLSWTAEMAMAWEACAVVVEAGDPIGGRMAFREVYLRMVAEARRAQRPVAWALVEEKARTPALRREAEAFFLAMDARQAEATRPPPALAAWRAAREQA